MRQWGDWTAFRWVPRRASEGGFCSANGLPAGAFASGDRRRYARYYLKSLYCSKACIAIDGAAWNEDRPPRPHSSRNAGSRRMWRRRGRHSRNNIFTSDIGVIAGASSQRPTLRHVVVAVFLQRLSASTGERRRTGRKRDRSQRTRGGGK